MMKPFHNDFNTISLPGKNAMAEVEFSVKENGIFRGEEENGGQKLNLEAVQDLTINDFGSKFLNEIDGTIQIS